MKNILKTRSFKINYTENYSYSNEIKNKGYAFTNSNTFQKIQKTCNFYDVKEQDVEAFISSWNDLDIDLFMSDKGKYRTRKHATFTIQNQHKIVLKNEYIPHFQTVEYNHLNGGIARHFTEIDKDTTENPIFKNLLKFAYSTFSEIKCEDWFVEAHQFRIKAKPNSIGKPTPEGIHRDGVDFILMGVIKRQNIQGGLTKIYDLNKKTEIQIDDALKADVGLRDVLVITFKKA